MRLRGPHGRLQRRMCRPGGAKGGAGHWLGATESVSPQGSHGRQVTAKSAKTAARRCKMGAVAKGGTSTRKARLLGDPGAREGWLGKDQRWGHARVQGYPERRSQAVLPRLRWLFNDSSAKVEGHCC